MLELGAVTETLADDGRLYQRAADAYLSATKQGRSALLVSPTWAEIEAVTDKVREALKAEGVVSQDEHRLRVFDSLSWTEAQKKNASQFLPGQRLRFVRPTKTFAQGETAEVVAVEGQSLKLRRADGREAAFSPSRSAACFDVGEARELKVAPGDWLLLQANAVAVRPVAVREDFINGERVQVREIQNGRIALADGRSLPAGFNAFTHGYAVTSHSSQGKTVDEVLLVASSRSFGAVNREQFYVSISRGRERVHVFTDDADLLARRVTDSHARKAAVELQGLRDGLAKLGFVPREQLKEKIPSPVAEDSAVRQRRPMRQTRLSTVQRLATALEDVRRWLGLNQTEAVKETVAEKIGPTETVKQSEAVKQTEAVRPARTVRETLRHQHVHRQQQRRSGGIHI